MAPASCWRTSGWLVKPVAIGRFHDEVVDIVRLGRRTKNDVGWPANIARENDLLLFVVAIGSFQVKISGSKNVSNIPILCLDTFNGVKLLSVGGNAT